MINQEKKNRIRYLANGVYTATVGTTNIGIITAEIPAPETPQNVYLIDSGADAEAGKEIYGLLSDLFPDGFTLQAVICTHSNSDHIGGNAWLQKKTGCGIWATAGESGSITYPLLQAALIWGGFPFQEITGPVYVAEPSTVTRIINFSDQIRLSRNRILSFIPLPGHFFDMVGIRTPDNTVFLADCVSSPAVLEKYGVTFIYDVAQYFATLDRIEALDAVIFVPSHADVTTDIRPLAALNRAKVHEIARAIEEICAEPQDTESVIQAIFRAYRLSMSAEQYVLVGSTIRSYLSWMKDSGRLDVVIGEDSLRWQARGVS